LEKERDEIEKQRDLARAELDAAAKVQPQQRAPKEAIPRSVQGLQQLFTPFKK
jgi:hypothetical protein